MTLQMANILFLTKQYFKRLNFGSWFKIKLLVFSVVFCIFHHSIADHSISLYTMLIFSTPLDGICSTQVFTSSLDYTQFHSTTHHSLSFYTNRTYLFPPNYTLPYSNLLHSPVLHSTTLNYTQFCCTLINCAQFYSTLRYVSISLNTSCLIDSALPCCLHTTLHHHSNALHCTSNNSTLP